MARNRRALVTAAIVVFALLLLVPSLVRLYPDALWFQELGMGVIFRTELVLRIALLVGVGAFAAGFLYLNLRHAQRGAVPDPTVIRLGNGAMLNLAELLRKLRLPISLFAGFLAGMWAAGLWMEVLRWAHRVPFGVRDPLFGRDVGVYVFSLPLLSAATGLLLTLVFLALLLVAPLYVLRRDIIIAPRHVRVERSTGIHLALLISAGLVLTALRLWAVEIPELLFSTTGPMVGASYADLHAALPGLRVLAGVALVAAIVVLIGGFRQTLVRSTLLAVGGYLLVALVARGLIPATVQNFLVEPTELTREAPQLAHHIEATRRAWGLDGVEVRELSGEAGLTFADIQANASTIRNVRLWDREPLLQTFGQLQEIRTYYDFVSVDDDRYWIDGEYRQVLLSPRELNPASLPTRNFINEHLTFTHGMGITLSPVDRSTPEGLPVLFIKDLPPESEVSLQVRRPQIYYGELTDNPVFVHTRRQEFDYPAGEENIFTSYTGKGGVALDSFLRRALFAFHLGSSNILLSGDLTPETRVLYRRNVMERARTALPFLRFDRDPYMVVAEDGTLQWILDAYTSTTRYPYAQRLTDGTSYMRNSVKVVIDAYDGTVQPYVVDPADPLIRSYMRAFPGVFRDLSEISDDLRSHFRYPEDLYIVQATLQTVYHMDEPEEFYQREDEWQIPSLEQGTVENPFMRRIVMRLPDQEEAEFIFMTPFTPRGKDNLASWLVARSDGEAYGTLRLYRFPKQSLVYGPRQVVNRIDQDTEIARQISLWDQRGSEVIRGELLVIPIEESLLYVQPLYLRAEGGRIPELKRVIVVYQNQVVMQETLERALAVLFGETPAPPVAAEDAEVQAAETPSGAATTVQPELLRRAREHYNRAIAAQREGNWSAYGEEIERLGQVLRSLNADSGP